MGFDFSGPLDEEKRIAYRLVGLGKGSDTQFDHVKEERYAIAPTLAIDFSDDTTLTLQGYLQHDPNGGYHGGVPADGTLSHHNGRHISREFFDGEPSKDDFDRTQRMFGYQLEHRIDGVWSARQNFRYLDSDVDLSQVYAHGWSASEPNKLNRYLQRRPRAPAGAYRRQHAAGRIRHRRGAPPCSPASTISAGAPWSTGVPARPRRWTRSTRSTATTPSAISRTTTTSAAGADRRLPPGPDRHRPVALLARPAPGLGQRHRQEPQHRQQADDDWEKFTGRIGALYLFDNGLAPYVSYSESFNPNAYSDASGTPLAPTEGKRGNSA
ncbi:TonB-dependent receptor [Pseudomonas aeruginosa]|nr:TonB-dependent receptor [Pseudomonas aeruginosa]